MQSTKLWSLRKKFFRFVIPSVLAQWVYTLYTMVDGIFVSKGVSEVALTAVNLSYPFVALLFALSLVFASGCSTVAAIFLGEGRKEKASEVFTQTVALLLAIGVIFSAAFFFHLESVARLLGAKTPEMVSYVSEYLRWIVPFTPFFLLSYGLEILMKTDGFPRKSAITITVGCLGNCVLDYLFVMVLQMGIKGAALATSLCQIGPMAVYLAHFLSRKAKRGSERKLFFRRFRFDAGVVGREVSVGFAAGITEMASGVLTFVFNRVILSTLGENALIGYTIAFYVSNVIVISTTGIAQGSQPLISYWYGKRREDVCRRLFRMCVATSAVYTAASLVLLEIGAPAVVTLYLKSGETDLISYCVGILRVFLLHMVPAGVNVVVGGYFTSLGKACASIVMAAGRGVVLPAAVLLLMAATLGDESIFFAPLIAELLCLGIGCAMVASVCKKE